MSLGENWMTESQVVGWRCSFSGSTLVEQKFLDTVRQTKKLSPGAKHTRVGFGPAVERSD